MVTDKIRETTGRTQRRVEQYHTGVVFLRIKKRKTAEAAGAAVVPVRSICGDVQPVKGDLHAGRRAASILSSCDSLSAAGKVRAFDE